MKNIFKINLMKSLILLLILFLISMIIFIFVLLNKDVIYSGIKINEINVSGLSREKAINLLKSKFQDINNNKDIVLSYNDKKYVIKGKDIDLTYNYYEIVDKAYNIGRENNIFKRLDEIYNASKSKYDFLLKLHFDENKLYIKTTQIANEIDIESVDAKILSDGNKLTIIDEKIGREVDLDKLKSKIIENISNNITIKIPVNIKIPKVDRMTLSKVNKKISTYKTYFNPSNNDRITNIRLASKAINDKVLLRNEMLSFNTVTGNRDKDSGYKEAKVIIKGEYVPEFGGGVCQVSSTLYNAVLLSDLAVVERHHHSIPSTYVDYGRDATVAYNYLDFKFRNNTQYPIYIQSILNQNSLTINIFSNEILINDIKIESEILETVEPKIEIIEDSALNNGERIVFREGRKGYVVETYKIKSNKNKEITKETISKDYYKPINTLIKVGK